MEAAESEFFVLPDLVSHCPYTLRVNPNYESVAPISEEWLLSAANHCEEKRKAFLGLKAGYLAAACYPDADEFHYRVIADYINFLFSFDDWTDKFNVHGTNEIAAICMEAMRDPVRFSADTGPGLLTKSYFSRFLQTAGPRCASRFVKNMELFHEALAQQSSDRTQGVVPDLQSYIMLRRDTSGCKPCFQLVEFAMNIDLPDEVVNHASIQAMEDASNDLVGWSNDIFSYSVEHARHDTHNMISVFVNHDGMTLQDAVNRVGSFCKESIETFENIREGLPSWGEQVDRDVAVYIDGLQNWIVGSLHWSFYSKRYFGKFGDQVKKTRIVEMLPPKPIALKES